MRVVDQFGERVYRRAVVELGLPLATVAERLGVAPSRLSWLMRARRLTVRMFERISRALEVGPEYWTQALPNPKPASAAQIRRRLIRRAIAGLPALPKKR